MADRLTGPGGQEENQSTESTPKEESALQRHLRRLGIFGEAKKETTESDDDEETDKPKKKFRKFFKGLFRNVVEPPQSQDSEARQRPGLESLFFGWEEPDTNPTIGAAVEAHGTETPEATVEGINAPEQIAEQPVDTVNRPMVSTPEQPSERHPMIVEISELAGDDESEQIKPNTPFNEAEPVTHPVTERATTPEFQTNPAIIERTDSQPAEKEVIIERRGPGIALPVVLVGAEYLARKHADRKLDTKFTAKSAVLEKSVKQGNVAREQLDTLVQQNKEQLEKLKRERQPILEKQSVPKPEKPQVERVAPVHEREVQIEAPKPQMSVERIEPAIQEKDTTQNEQYKIMEQVADAAEHNVPVEKAFERSHEVKDDISTPSSAASIGAIMAAQVEEQKRVARVQALHRQMGDASSGLPVINDSQTADMYQQAVKRGFWSAVIIIILGIIAYLVK